MSSGAPGGSVEHKTNGLAYNLDNWLYNAKSGWRYRFSGGKLLKEKTSSSGQWGISQDDQGRILANTNSSLVAMDTIPPTYSVRNANHKFAGPITVKMANEVYPIRITCGVNRGYMADTLDKRGYLRNATGSGGLTIYRGDNFPPAFRGNAFIPEPTGLLLKRAILTEDANGLPVATQAYPDKEFIASTDANATRWVNAHTAPDGTLYLVDLYHGIVQHREFVTTYLRNQIIKRKLDKRQRDWPDLPGPLERDAARSPPRMEEESPVELVAHLSHPEWLVADAAQRLIVQSGDATAAPALHALVASEKALALAKVHAIWTLEGLGQLQPDDVRLALQSSDPVLLSHACRVAETFQGTPVEADAAALVASLKATSPAIARRQSHGSESSGAG